MNNINFKQMKKTTIIFLLTFLCCKSYGQNIEGIWQKDSPIVGSGYGQYYKFINKGEFEYHASGYDGLARIRTIGGKYQIKKDSIYFTVEYMDECLGGNTIERSWITTLNDTWEIVDCESKRTYFEEKTTWAAGFKYNSSDTKNKFIEIDDWNKYYLVQEDE